MGDIKCGKCGTEINDNDADFCSKCGFPLKTPPICPKCGHVAVDSTRKFCSICGTPLNNQVSSNCCWNCGSEICDPMSACCPKCTVLLKQTKTIAISPSPSNISKSVKEIIIYGGIILLVFCFFAIFPLFFHTSSSSDSAKNTNYPVKESPTIKITQIPFSESLKQELQKEMVGGTVTEVIYNPDNKGVVIWLECSELWDAEMTREAYARSTLNLMPILLKYSDDIDSIKIAGKSKMVDSKGYESMTKVFQVSTTMDSAKSVNWANMGYFEPLDALDNNFDNVWWHQVISP